MFLLANEDGKAGVEKAVELLNGNNTSINSVVEGITMVEEDPHSKIVGLGGLPDIGGDVTLDAAIMDGETINFGAVGYIKNYVNAIKIAEVILHDSPHCLLVGDGAERFAKEKNISLRSPLVEKAKEQWRELFKTYVKEDIPDSLESSDLAEWCKKAILGAHGHLFKDTTVFMAKDHKENIAVGTSTSGWPLKYPGRLGDSPVVGAGFYADNRYGAAACTNTGEMALRANTAFAVVNYMKIGLSVEESVYQAVRDLTSLKPASTKTLVYTKKNCGSVFQLDYTCKNKDDKYIAFTFIDWRYISEMKQSGYDNKGKEIYISGNIRASHSEGIGGKLTKAGRGDPVNQATIRFDSAKTAQRAMKAFSLLQDQCDTSTDYPF